MENDIECEFLGCDNKIPDISKAHRCHEWGYVCRECERRLTGELSSGGCDCASCSAKRGDYD